MDAGVLQEEKALISKCEDYAKKIKDSSVSVFYPFFAKEGKRTSKDSFTYLNLNFGGADAFIRIYEFENTSLKQSYENLKNILKKNENIKIRETLPNQNAQDSLKFQVSVKNENDGHTCYIYKNSDEVWIQSNPQKGENFVFILKQENQNSKLYYYEKITSKN